MVRLNFECMCTVGQLAAKHDIIMSHAGSKIGVWVWQVLKMVRPDP